MDTVSNMIIKIKNAGNAGHDQVLVPYSKLKHSIAQVLQTEGFIKEVQVSDKKNRKILEISLFLNKRVPKIRGVKRVSKPSRRIYQKASELRPVRSGYGSLIVSTSQGVMTGNEARRAGLGGEALFQIW